MKGQLRRSSSTSSIFEKKNINHSFDDFCFVVQKKYHNSSIQKAIYNSITNPENLLGIGREGSVYKLDKIFNYVIKIPNNCPMKTVKEDFVTLKDDFPFNNFGQAVAVNSDNVEILKRVYGNPHGPLMGKVSKQNNKLFLDDAIMTLNQIVNISKFPIKSYIDFANQIKVINQHSIFCVDMLNPNNLMVDNNNKSLQIIDLFNKNKNPILEDFKGDVHSMINLILCALYHSEIYSLLNNCQREELKSSVNVIVNKCILASKIVNLPISKVNPEELYDGIMDFVSYMKGTVQRGSTLSQKYREFRNIYSNILPEIRKLKIVLNNKQFFEKIKLRLTLSNTIRPYYLMYLYESKKLSGDHIFDIIALFSNKIPQKDLQFFRKLLPN